MFKRREKNYYQLEPEEILMDKMAANSTDVSDNFEHLEADISRKPILLLRFLVLGVCIVYGFLAFKSQVLKSSIFENLALGNATRYKIINAPRGIIYDRYGTKLADNIKSYSLMLMPADLPTDATAKSNLFTQVNTFFNLAKEDSWWDTKVVKSKSIDPIILKNNLSQEEIQKFEPISNNFPGFSIVPSWSRSYSGGEADATVLGYVGKITPKEVDEYSHYPLSDLVGKMGLEKSYENYLHGVSGKEYYQVDARQKTLQPIGEKKPQNGSDLVLTIDSELQNYLYTSLKESTINLGVKKAVGIAMNPKNGEVLAMVSLPSFDSNIFSQGGSASVIQSIFQDANHPMFNRAISGLYSPGSTIKPLMAMAVLNEKIIPPQDNIIDKGRVVIPNPYDPSKESVFRDWKLDGHGLVNLRKALAVSCNTYFYTVGGGYGSVTGLGKDRIKQYWQLFRLDKLTGIDLPGESTGVLADEALLSKTRPNDPVWHLGDTYNISIGQGDLQVTPLALLSYISAIAENGNFWQPHLVKQIKNGEDVIKTQDPQLTTKLNLPENYFHIVQDGMRAVVTEGSAVSLNNLGISLAGKTGTPQVSGGQKINALFVAYAPYEDPQIAVLVLFEGPKEGSAVAIPVVGKVLDWWNQNRYAKGL
ncbi:MAG TPA: penicillin-binding protein 2 [Candidatus Paceibacterota bacterium]|nr:penicillin-binding protein 2 [Candidatus Paceibacterota bacterium]